MADKYDGWLIHYYALTPSDIEDMGSGTNALDGVDIDASARRYASMVEDELRATFPGAQIDSGSDIHAWPPDGPSDEDEERRIIAIGERLQGRDGGTWLVDA